MKIEQEQFKKLKQNDRIEYLLRTDRLEKKYSNNYANAILKEVYTFIYFLGWVLLALPLYYVAFGKEVIFRLLPITVVLLRLYLMIIILVIVMYMVFGIVDAIMHRKYRKELFNEFFDIKAKVKNEKK